jgi:hypothetical protein
MQSLNERKDDQIMALEMWAVILGMQSFKHLLENKCVHIWIDNTAGQGALAKGASRQSDHNAICHLLWHIAAEFNVEAHVHRVPTELNIADLPSREDYRDLLRNGAERVTPVFSPSSTDFPVYCELVAPQSHNRNTMRRRLLRIRRSSGQ